MTRFLVSEDNPGGYKLEDILNTIRSDILKRCIKIAQDERAEAQHVLANNMEVLQHLTKAIELARDSSRTLDRAFGPSAAPSGPPRIGIA
jgi:predicted  nucleic acid-binding Zn-ribbon protein